MEILYGARALDHEMKKMAFLADKKLILASPFFKLDPEMKRILALKKSEGTQIILFTRTGTLDLKQNPQNYLTQLFNFPRLHTKLYVSESTAIFASANLYDFSLQHNHEMGLLFTKQWDPEAYEKLNSEIQFLKCPVAENTGVQLVWDYNVQTQNGALQKGSLAGFDQIKEACKKCGITYSRDYTGIHRVGEEIFIFCNKSSVKGVLKAKSYSVLWNDYILGPLGIGHFQCTASNFGEFFDDENRVKSEQIKIFVDNIYYEESEIYCYQAPGDKNGDFGWAVILCTKENKSNKVRVLSSDEPVPAEQSEASFEQDDPFPSELPPMLQQWP